MTLKFRLPNYFTASLNRQIDELYVSTAIADLAIAVIMVFEPIFLFSVLHLTVPEILIYIGVLYAFYILFIPWGAKFASRFGYKHGIYMSIPFQVLFWVSLYFGQHNAWILYSGPILYALEKSFFWPSFHASVARFAQHQQRGREFSGLYAVANVVNIIGPFIGGFISERFGLQMTFLLASALYICSFIPLYTAREIFVPKIYQFKETWNLYRQFPKKFLGYLGFGEEVLVLTIWPIFIYLIIKDYEKIGLLVTIATMFATVLALYIGKITDQYSKRVLVKVGAFFLFLVWLARLIVNNVASAFASDTFYRTSKDIVFIPLSTLTYERADATHIMPYVVFFEQSLSIGKLLACALGALLFYLTGSFVVLFILGAFFSLLYMYI